MEAKEGHIEALIQGVGFGDKAARMYRAALQLGEATIQELARQSGEKRTTLYYTLKELQELGAIHEVRRGKRQHFIAVEPRLVLRAAQQRVDELSLALPDVESLRLSKYKKPGVYFSHGPSGFKAAWDRVFESKEKEYRIITSAEHFLDFVPEKYVLSEIIKGKRARGIRSRQLITDSSYARSIVSKDAAEGRTSRFLSPRHTLPYTEIIGDSFVIFISPRPDNLILTIESDTLAKTQRSHFELLWSALP
jgi:sugar-specific transcriptional regulator TrmB